MDRRPGYLNLSGIALMHPVISGAAPATPLKNRLYSDSLVKGWIETSGGGAWTIDNSLNVSSITDNATGDFTINWATAWDSANYAIVATTINVGGNLLDAHESTTTTAKSSTVVRITLPDYLATLTDPSTGVQVLAVGD